MNKELVDYRPTLIPNGYTEFYSDTTEDTIIVVYANEEGEMLKFSYRSKYILSAVEMSAGHFAIR